jgi:hypothetical protein
MAWNSGISEHIEPHFHGNGLCQCPCDQCTLSLTRRCVCIDCPCDDDPDHLTPQVNAEGPR